MPFLRKYIRKWKPSRFIRRTRVPSKYRGKPAYKRRFNKKVKRVVRGLSEKKFAHETISESITDSQNANFIAPYIPAQGTGKNQRIGNKFFYRFFGIKGFIFITDTQVDDETFNVVRLSLVTPRDTQFGNTDYPSGFFDSWDPLSFKIHKDYYFAFGKGSHEPTNAIHEPTFHNASIRMVRVHVKLMRSQKIIGASSEVRPLPRILIRKWVDPPIMSLRLQKYTTWNDI